MSPLIRINLVRVVGACVLAALTSGETLFAQPQDGKTYKSVRILLRGDWKDAEIYQTAAFGTGNQGKDLWSQEIEGEFKHAYWNQIQYDKWRRCYYFTYSLQSNETMSTAVSAIFRYRKNNAEGVFSASFPWPN
jgi:hypothetical protein